jgi:threonine/homoserine/homoserine lactone efflux protein
MSLQHAMAFLLFAVVAAITPGPSNTMLTATGAIAGMLRGLPCLLGVATGMGLMMFAAGIGLAGLMVDHPVALAVLKAGGAAFLLWLSWKIACAPYGDAPVAGKAVGFAGAFAFQWLNPKSWLVSVGAASAHLRPDAGVLGQALWIAGLFFAVAFACGLVWLAFGVLLRRILKSPRLQRAFNVTMGALLALSTLFVL